MTCYYPKPAYYIPYTKINEKTGEIYQTRKIKFLPEYKIDEETPLKENIVMIPCQKCEGCRISQSNDLATRCILEAKCHKDNCFITLTYNNKNLPKNRTLVKKDFQLFWKRLRKHIGNQGPKIKYLISGEYGPRTLRPHAHAIIFGWKPKDLKPYTRNEINDILYTSKELTKIWGKGYTIIGNVTFKSAAYVARYCLKKAYGRNKEWNLKHNRTPEFTLSSKKGGIGISAFENKALWAEIKQQNGILIKDGNTVKLKKIPQYLKKKWKELDDREEYFKKLDENAHAQKEQMRARETSKNAWQYLKQIVEKAKEQIKRLDKRKDI